MSALRRRKRRLFVLLGASAMAVSLWPNAASGTHNTGCPYHHQDEAGITDFWALLPETSPGDGVSVERAMRADHNDDGYICAYQKNFNATKRVRDNVIN